MRTRPTLTAAGAVVVGLLLAACGGVTYADTPVPSAPSTTTTPAPTAATATCQPAATASYAPLPSTDPAQLPADVRKRGTLRVGISADTLLMSARNPFTNDIEGFDIGVAQEVAKAMYGSSDTSLTEVVITSADRIPALTGKRVDMVARTLSMTCDRWKQIAFSAEYYQAGLELLVRKGSSATTFAQLAAGDALDRKVCAPTGTTTYAKVASEPGITPVGAATHTACLVLFQSGQVGAIAGDDTVLAGLAAQDPYAYVPQDQTAQTTEPYGLGFRSDDVTTVRFANAVVDAMKKDGRWQALYDRWLKPRLGPGSPPASTYGRAVP